MKKVCIVGYGAIGPVHARALENVERAKLYAICDVDAAKRALCKEKYDVLDNNFFAAPDWRDAIADLRKQRLPVKFHGVDVRIMDEEQAEALNSVKMKGYVHIAWDLPQLDLTSRLEAMTKYIKPYKIACYVLVGFNSTREQDLHRLNTLKRLGILPFVQAFRDYDNSRKPTQYEKDLGRWANRAWLFKSMDFEDYEPRKGFKCKEYFL